MSRLLQHVDAELLRLVAASGPVYLSPSRRRSSHGGQAVPDMLVFGVVLLILSFLLIGFAIARLLSRRAAHPRGLRPTPVAELREGVAACIAGRAEAIDAPFVAPVSGKPALVARLIAAGDPDATEWPPRQVHKAVRFRVVDGAGQSIEVDLSALSSPHDFVIASRHSEQIRPDHPPARDFFREHAPGEGKVAALRFVEHALFVGEQVTVFGALAARVDTSAGGYRDAGASAGRFVAVTSGVTEVAPRGAATAVWKGEAAVAVVAGDDVKSARAVRDARVGGWIQLGAGVAIALTGMLAIASAR